MREIVAEIVLLCASIYTIFTGAVLLWHNLVQVAAWVVRPGMLTYEREKIHEVHVFPLYVNVLMCYT